MMLLVIRAPDPLTIQIPPPAACGWVELPLIRLPATVAAPAANREIPPPSAPDRFPVMVLPRIWRLPSVPAPTTWMPPPPGPLLQPLGALPEMTLSRMAAAEQLDIGSRRDEHGVAVGRDVDGRLDGRVVLGDAKGGGCGRRCGSAERDKQGGGRLGASLVTHIVCTNYLISSKPA